MHEKYNPLNPPFLRGTFNTGQRTRGKDKGLEEIHVENSIE